MIRFPYHSYRRKNAIVANANSSRGAVKVRAKPAAIKGQEGNVRVSTLISIPVGTLGFLMGTYLQFRVLSEQFAESKGRIPIEELNFIDILSHPTLTSNYLSMMAAGFIGALVGVGAAKLPAMLNQNGDK